VLHAAFVRSPHAQRASRASTWRRRAGRRDCGGLDRPRSRGHDGAAPDGAADRRPLADGDVDAPDGQGAIRRRSRRLRDRDDRYRVEDACAGVDVQYEPLPAVIDPERAREPARPRVDESIPGNCPYHRVFSHGDVDAALGAADRVVQVRFHQGRQTHVPMEPRGCLRAGFPVTTRSRSGTRRRSRIRCGRRSRRARDPESAVRVIAPDVGGGFGQKIPLYREELTTARGVTMLGRPVRWWKPAARTCSRRSTRARTSSTFARP